MFGNKSQEQTLVFNHLHIQSIEIDTSVSAITVESYDGEDIHLTYTNKESGPYWNIFENEGILFIKLREKVTFLKKKQNHDYKLVLKLPSNYILNGSINNGMGYVNIKDLSVGQFSVQTGTGNVSCEKVVVDELSINVGAGNIRLHHLQSHHLCAETGTGYISINHLQGSAELNAGVGNIQVKLENNSDVKLDLSTGLGRVTTKGFAETFSSNNRTQEITEGSNTIQAVTGVGNITVQKESDVIHK